jgi:hypothetical protein
MTGSPDEKLRQFISDYQYLNWSKTGFDTKKVIQAAGGTVLELGGPTSRGWMLLDPEIPEPTIVTNINNPVPKYDPMTGAITEYDPVDKAIDATAIDYPDRSFACVMASYLPTDIHDKAIPEAYRILSDGGILIWRPNAENIFKHKVEEGFECVRTLHRIVNPEAVLSGIAPTYSIEGAIFQKIPLRRIRNTYGTRKWFTELINRTGGKS